jgi:amino acid transporter
MLVMGIAFVVLTFLYRTVFGADFLHAAGVVGIPGFEGVVMPIEGAPAQVPFFTAIAGGNVILTILMSLWVLIIAFFVGGTTLIYATRAMLAWSIDGVAPEKLGEVNDRYHTPHWALLVGAVIGFFFLFLYTIPQVLGPVSGFLGLAVAFIAVSVWAIFFPFVRRSKWEGSPIAFRVGGFPLLSLLGIVASIFVVPLFIRLFFDAVVTLNPVITVQGAVLGVIAAIIWFYVYRAYRRSRGVDIDRRYAEIPIE